MKEVKFRFPGDSDRTLIVGGTGSGKTQQGIHLLAHQNFAEMTWLAIDFKGRDILEELPVSEIVQLRHGIPQAPGLFYMRAPMNDPQATSDLFLAAERRGSVGLYIDEALPIGLHNTGFKTCLFAGRSAQIAMIYCSQTPHNIDPLARSQATFFNVFDVADVDDRKAVRRYIRTENMDVEPQLERFQSYWYDVRERGGCILGPSPDVDESAALILRRLPPRESALDSETLEVIVPAPSRPRRRI